MRYFSIFKGESAVEELSKERAKVLLERCYLQNFVDDIFDNDRSFRLETMFRTIWTQTDDGLVPMAGFIGVCGIE